MRISDWSSDVCSSDLPSDDPSLSPLQLWCNESQERYVLGVSQSQLAAFEALCERERCPFAVVGTATAEERLVVGHGATAMPEPSLLPLAGEGAPTADEGALGEHPVVSEAPPIDLPLDFLSVNPPTIPPDPPPPPHP